MEIQRKTSCIQQGGELQCGTMRGYLTRIVWLTGTALLAAAPGLALQAADVKDARVWAGSDYTRVVFDLSGPAKYKLSQNGDQIVLDLADSRAAGQLEPSAQGLFKGLNSAPRGDALRLTASVAPNSQPKSFLLGPSGQAGYRLVLDLYPGNGKPSTAPAKSAAPDEVGDTAVASSK